MVDVAGRKFIFAVAQEPFEVPTDSGVFNQFCALLPVFDADGAAADPHDFPDNGDVWWMLRAGTRGLAEPGRLVSAVVEDSVKAGTQGLAQFQAIADSVAPLHGRDYIEIIDLPAHTIEEPRDLIRPGFSHLLDHNPVDTVCIRWKDVLLGRFRVQAERSSSARSQWEVRLTPEAADHTGFRVGRDVVDRVVPPARLTASVDVSLEMQPLHKSTVLNHVHYLLVDSDALMREVQSDPDYTTISMRTDREVVHQLAKTLLTRSKRQQLMGLLGELENVATQSEQPVDAEELRTLSSLRSTLEADVKAATELSQAVIGAGFMKDQITEAIAAREERHIAENAARLQSEVNRRLGDVRMELEGLQRDRNQIESELEHIRARRNKELDKELDKKREDFERDLGRKEAEAQERLEKIQRQEKVLGENLKKVASTLIENRDDIVNDLLTIAPVLSRFGILGGLPATGAPAELVTTAAAAPTLPAGAERESPSFRVPEFSVTGDVQDVDEADFFTRLKEHTKARGYRYREIDILSFHVSTKCADLTILGGQPGTGKSSLPRLYAEALRGDLPDPALDHFLHVAVSPSWLDSRDLLGHLNALNHSFQPADCGLYKTLIYAQEEHNELGDESEMYMVCLDEMNLAHVEHYFGDFLQILEMPAAQRRVRVFSEDAVPEDSPLRRWASLTIPRSVRFVGTVNFDETTKQLSQRLLDRVNLIRLPADQLPLELEDATDATAHGAPIRMKQYNGWIRNSAAYNDDLGTLIDSLRDDLRTLNCSMNPRRFSAIRRFLASWPEAIMSIDRAIDVQFAQRILPQVRGLFQPGASQALESIRRKLEQHRFPFEESQRVLDYIYRSESPEFVYGGETSEP